MLGGGTELILVLRAGLARARHLVDVKRVPGMTSIWSGADGVVHIGGAATHTRIAAHGEVTGRLPDVTEAARHLGNPRVRSTGTLGGNLCFAEPHSDPAAVLVARSASVELRSVRGSRMMSVDDFLLGTVETARDDDEILTRIDVPATPGDGAAYRRFATSERPTAGIAAVVTTAGGAIEAARIVVSSIGARPIRLRAAEQAALGRAVGDAERWARVVASAAAEEADPVSDQYGPADYKRHIVGLTAADTLAAACGRVTGA